MLGEPTWEAGVKMRTVPINADAETMRELYEGLRKEHKCFGFFDTLEELAGRDDVHHVAEFGVFQGGSTSAFLSCKIDTLTSSDIDIGIIDESLFRKLKPNRVEWDLRECDSLSAEPVECDLLLLDTVHTYDHVIAEIRHLGGSVRRFIVVHDTMYPPARKNPERLVGDAVKQYAEENGWELIRENKIGSGHMVIERC